MTGWISKKNGRFMYRFYTTRAFDGKKVEQMKTIGLISALRTEKAAWQEAERLGFTKLSSTPTAAQLTFDALARHFINKHCIQRWGTTLALDISPLALEAWFESLSETFAWQSIAKFRSVMSQVFNHAYRHGLLSGGKDNNPVRLSRCPVSSTYEAVVVSPEQMISMLNELDTPETQCEWTLALLHAATGMRPEEAFGLKWSDVNWEKGQIHINRAWSKGKETAGKTKESMTQVVMSPTLAEALKRWRNLTLYGEATDWVFASTKEKGKIPRSASTCGKRYLRPAAVTAGVIPTGYKGRFGWHNMRHSLATFLAGEVDSSVTMKMLRHKKLSTTLEIYSHSVNSKQGEAQQKYLSAIGLQLVSGKSTGSETQKQRA